MTNINAIIKLINDNESPTDVANAIDLFLQSLTESNRSEEVGRLVGRLEALDDNKGGAFIAYTRTRVQSMLQEKSASSSSSKPDINAVNDKGETALFTAIKNKKEDVALELIRNGADVTKVYTSYYSLTVLDLAIEKGQNKVVDALIKHDDAEQLLENGLAPMYYAAYYGNIMAVQLLIDRKVNINDKARALVNGTYIVDNTPLHLAIYKGEVAVANLLLDQDNIIQSIKTKNGDGKTPLHFAFDKANIDLMIKLIKKGADFSEKFGTSGQTLLAWALENESVELVIAIVEKSKHDSPTFIELHQRIQSRNISAGILKVLGDNKYIETYENKIINNKKLIKAIWKGYDVEIVENLITLHGADPNTFDFYLPSGTGGWAANLFTQEWLPIKDYPLHRSIFRGKKECYQLLWSKGANPTLINTKGKTALHCAVNTIEGEIDIAAVDLLLSSKYRAALIDEKDLEGKTALSYCLDYFVDRSAIGSSKKLSIDEIRSLIVNLLDCGAKMFDPDKTVPFHRIELLISSCATADNQDMQRIVNHLVDQDLAAKGEPKTKLLSQLIAHFIKQYPNDINMNPIYDEFIKCLMIKIAKVQTTAFLDTTVINTLQQLQYNINLASTSKQYGYAAPLVLEPEHLVQYPPLPAYAPPESNNNSAPVPQYHIPYPAMTQPCAPVQTTQTQLLTRSYSPPLAATAARALEHDEIIAKAAALPDPTSFPHPQNKNVDHESVSEEDENSTKRNNQSKTAVEASYA